MKPAVDRRGKSLSPGERFLNWCKGIVMVWPIMLPLLGGAVYGNSEAVKRLVHGTPTPVAEGTVVTPDSSNIPPEVIQSLASIVAKLAEHDEQFEQLEALSEKYDGRLQEQVTINAQTIKAWHDN